MRSSASFSLPRRTSVRRPRRPRARHSTIDSLRLPPRIPPSPDCSRYTRQPVPIPSHSEPSGRRTRVAKTAGRCEQRAGSPPAPSSPSAIEALESVVAAAVSKREHGCPLRRKRANRRDLCHDLDGGLQLRVLPPQDAAKTLVPGEWCPDTGPSIQRLSLPRPCLAADIALVASFRASATSRTARRLLDKCAVSAFATRSCTRSGACRVMISRGARFSVLLPASAVRRRTEVRRSKLKRVVKKALVRRIGRRKRLPHTKASTYYKPRWDRHSACQRLFHHRLKLALRGIHD